MADCWREAPGSRTTFSSLRDLIKGMQESHAVGGLTRQEIHPVTHALESVDILQLKIANKYKGD